MWLITTQGFYSAVAHRDDPHKVMVRARVREDIEALAAQIPEIEPYSEPDSDYKWRAVVSRSDWERAVGELAAGIDYENLKSAVAERQGYGRALRYSDVWQVLYGLQADDRQRPAS